MENLVGESRKKQDNSRNFRKRKTKKIASKFKKNFMRSMLFLTIGPTGC